MTDAGLSAVALNFSPQGLMVLNLILAVVIFGVALDLTVEDFRRVARAPRAVVIGLLAQFLLLPALTWLLVMTLRPAPSLALGMFLVAACPGGNISNFLAHFAGGNAALSVSMSAVSTAAAMVMTPLNFAFWGSLYAPAAPLMQTIALDPVNMASLIAIVLLIPLGLGLLLAHRKPALAARAVKPMKVFSLLVFLVFVLAALAANWQNFINYIGWVIGIVIAHNLIALAGGYGAARAARLPPADARAVSLEIGIQNSGLGLVLIFNFFDGNGGMALIAAAWGIWHLISGLSLAGFWARRPVEARS